MEAQLVPTPQTGKVVMSSDNNIPLNRKWIIPLLPKQLPGKIVQIFGKGHYKIECFIESLPLSDETFTEYFVALQHDVEDYLECDDIVLFTWQNPGHRSRKKNDELGDPRAINVCQINLEEAQKVTHEIQERLGIYLKQEIQKEHEGKQLEINKKLQEIDQKLNLIKEKTKNIDLYQEELEQKYNELLEKITFVEEQQKQLEPFGVLTSRSSENHQHSIDQDSRLPDNFLDYWDSHLQNSGLLIDTLLNRTYLNAILAALYLGRFVLLNGTVGVGKTRLVRESAKILGGQSKIIPVRPAWLDTSDLIGFYDPIQEIFRPTSFLTAMREAGNYPDRFHFVCLDELNLAKIENYGADLLSCLEYAREDKECQENDEGLLLYSRDIWEALINECQSLYTHKNTLELSGKQRLNHLQSFLKSYPSYNFAIPKNLVLLGTLNSDETTYNLSPKFIDRSFVITYPQIQLINEQNKITRQIESFPISISISLFRSKIEDILDRRSFHNFFNDKLKILSSWNEMYFYDNQLGTPLGYRAIKDLEVFMAIASFLNISLEESFSCFVMSKILPRIHFYKNDKNQLSFEKWLEKLEQYELETYNAHDNLYILPKLKQQLEDSPYISYWG